jgi:high affinity Mn2+ porin
MHGLNHAAEVWRMNFVVIIHFFRQLPTKSIFITVALLMVACGVASAEPAWTPQLLGLQFNGIYQNVPAFPSPYQGPNSFTTADGKGEDFTQTYGVYLGSQLAPTLQIYLDAEWFLGNGVSNGVGLGGYVNGDVIRVGSTGLQKIPYVARLYLRYFIPLSSETEKVERGMDQISGDQPIARWEVKAGKFALADDFDQNRYANNNRTQFLNYDFLYNTAWDYAEDIRGYSYGFVTSLFQPRWKLAFGVFMEPKADGTDFYYFNVRDCGYNMELTLKPNDVGTVIRVLSYFNEAQMGSYNAALALGSATSTPPNLMLVQKPGGTKYGFGLNVEQPLMDEGETGIFGRLGWNNGSHESWTYTESDRHASLGAQLSGVHWGRKEDRVGIAYGINGLSTPHKNYLAAGGSGILLGDGKLNYGLEQVIETYYRIQLGRYVQLSPDFQYIQNPGYNRDRGPAEVYSLRLRLSY